MPITWSADLVVYSEGCNTGYEVDKKNMLLFIIMYI